MVSEGCPSGQREQTVNLPAIAYGGSNPPPSTVGKASAARRKALGESCAGLAQLVERQLSKLNVVGSNPSSRSGVSEDPSGFLLGPLQVSGVRAALSQ